MISQFLTSHTLELIAASAGFINIYLVARNNIWNWLFGIINVSLYAIIFFHTKLYADMGLQLVFLVLQFYGLYQWRYGGKHHAKRSITQAPNTILLSAFFITVFLFLSIVFLLEHYTDSTTVYADAFITSCSLTAQWMMSKKWLEHWALWIVINLISIGLYFYKNLYFTSGLYVIFLYFCVMGYRIWHKELLGSCARNTNTKNTNTKMTTHVM